MSRSLVKLDPEDRILGFLFGENPYLDLDQPTNETEVGANLTEEPPRKEA